MAVTAMLDSGYQAIIGIIDVLSFIVATFPPDFVKIGEQLREQNQFWKSKMAAGAILMITLPAEPPC